jgi:hypothetical protein
MTVRNIVIVAMTATAAAGPAAATPSAPAATASIQPTAARSTLEETNSAAAAIDLDVTPNGLLAMTLTWSGGTEPYDVMIEPSKGQGRYESDIDDTSLTVATERDRDYCFQVFGSDGSESGRECVSPSS